jgi:hypothetical protein
VGEHENGTAVAAARAQGEADARDGSPMNHNYWHRPDEIKDAYAEGYQSVKRPKRPRPARPPAGPPPPRKSQLRVWKG